MKKNPSPNAQSGEPTVAARIRGRRKQVCLTMQEVGDGVSLTGGFIIQVERDLAAPSLTSLTSIVGILQSHVTDFLQPRRNDAKISREALRELYNVPGGIFSYERLSTTFRGSLLTAVLIHEQPGHSSELMRHPGEELYFVLKGALTVTLDGVESVLEQGDSIHFDSRRLHNTWNHTDRESVIFVWHVGCVWRRHDILAWGNRLTAVPSRLPAGGPVPSLSNPKPDPKGLR